MHDDFRYWPYTIITGIEPGTLDPRNDSSSDNSSNIEPFLVINVALGVVILAILLRRNRDN